MAVMTTETKEAMHAWAIDAAKTMGIPATIAGILLFFQYTSSERDFQRAMKEEERYDAQTKYVNETLSAQLRNSTAALEAINETIKGFREDQRETRQVLREVQATAK